MPFNTTDYEVWTYSEAVAAKYYARGIVINRGLGLWAGIGGDVPPILQAVRNLSTVLSGAEPANLPLEIESEADLIRRYAFSLSNGDRLVAVWTDGVAVDDDPGVAATLTLPGVAASEVVGIDVLYGFEQQLITEQDGANLVIRDLLVRDYPTFVRLSGATALSPNTITIGPGAPIRLGYLLAESTLTESSWLGLDSRRAVEVALADAGGQLLGHPVELMGFDTQCNKLAAQRAARLLAAEPDILGVIGTTCSVEAAAALQELSGASIVLVSPSNSDPALTAPESHHPLYLRTFPSDAVQAQAVARFAYAELGARTLATIYYANDPYSLHIRDSVCQEFADLGGECVAERTVNRGDTIMTALLNRIGQAAPDALYAVLAPPEASRIVSQWKDTTGLKDTALILQELSFSPALLELSGEDAVGVYVSKTAAGIDGSSDAYQAFLLGYRDLFGGAPDSPFHPFAYDAAAMLLDAIRRAAIPLESGALLVDREAVRAQMFATREFDRLTGSLTCSPAGDCAAAALGGIVYVIDSGDPGTWNPGVGLAANPVQVWPEP
jgi:branched-chain amino acid transport system substrate-binding protein